MREEASAEFLAAVQGSNWPVAYADVWLGSEIRRQNVPIAGGQATWVAGNAVEDRVSIVLVDDHSAGSQLKDIVHSYGCRINVRAGFALPSGEETVSLGWFDVTDTDAIEQWQWFDWRDPDDPVKVNEVVTIEADGILSVVARSALFTPTQPTSGGDAWAAIQSLCLDVVPVLDPDFSAKAVPAGIVFDTDRLKAIQSIADLWGAKPVATNLGQLTLVVPGAGEAVPAYGLWINIEEWRNQTKSADLRNGVRFQGKTPEGVDLWGYATEAAGPLFWGGPFGRRPAFASSDLMTTQSMVDQAAATELARLKASRSAVQQVKALWNPAQELRDRPQLVLANRTVDSEILAITLPLGVRGGAMDVTLKLPLLLEEG